MRNGVIFVVFLVPFLVPFVDLRVEAAPGGVVIQQMASLLRWSTGSSRSSSTKAAQSDGSQLQFESGYLVETVVEGKELGIIPHAIRVSEDGELYAVDALKSNIVRITPPLSQYSRARLVAGSFQGYTGHTDGKPVDARFNHPKGVTMDDKGNVYVADTANLAIRKIGEYGVTTIAGGKSNVAGYTDGPSEDAKFSNDFDVVYVGRTCSLLVVDRGNAALRQISLNQEDCDYQYNSISSTDLILVIGTVLVGYATCLIQQGYGASMFMRMEEASDDGFHKEATIVKPTPTVGALKEDSDAGWPSISHLFLDISKIAIDAFGSILQYVPRSIWLGKYKNKNLTPLRDSLVMPEDNKHPNPLFAQMQRATIPVSETRHLRPITPVSETRHMRTANPAFDARPAISANVNEAYLQHKLQKSKTATLKDPSLSSKYRSSKRQDSGEQYESSEAPPSAPYGQLSSKNLKERTRHRQRDRNGEVRMTDFRAAGSGDTKPEIQPGEYSDGKFEGFIRSKYRSDELFNF